MEGLLEELQKKNAALNQKIQQTEEAETRPRRSHSPPDLSGYTSPCLARHTHHPDSSLLEPELDPGEETLPDEERDETQAPEDVFAAQAPAEEGDTQPETGGAFGRDELLQGLDGVGADVKVKLQKAKIQALEEQRDKLIEELKRRDKMLLDTRERGKADQEERAKLDRLSRSLEQQMGKLQQQLEQQQQRNAALSTELEMVQKEFDALGKERKQVAAGSNTRELRLNRALEEIETLRTQLKSAKADSQEIQAKARQQEELFRQESRRFQRQKMELLAAFRKQMKLIDILKRQKTHIEASRLFSFTEEEFVKTIELGAHLPVITGQPTLATPTSTR
ncbi:hypothetical protein PAPYR_6262 [Paratrimastix pyriformis]|uniref:Uncharacterized protein n=1 Tax=Paratrimastix pyriformis TaxID=342808 RepID=A0ABQ8UFT9_9EUKA|nr:hypothetical protein PAPYR_6262 [Paratrimastix pyriformis]